MAPKLFTSLPKNIREEVMNYCTSIEPLLSAEKGRKFFENYLTANQSKEAGDAETTIGDFIKYWELWKTAASIIQTDDSSEKIRLASKSIEKDFSDATAPGHGLVTEDELSSIREAVDAENSSEINSFFGRCKSSAQQLLDENVFPSVAGDLKDFCSRKIKLKCNLV